MSSLLEVKSLCRNFGGLKAVRDVNFNLERGEIVGLIGPNGAGKSTTFSVVSGTMSPSAGTVAFKGQNLVGLRPNQIVKLGLARTFQSTVIYHNATVIENVLRGSFSRNNANFWIGMLQLQRTSGATDAAYILDLLSLRPFADRVAKTLPYGLQRRLGIAIALASEPELLLLDEPAAGLNDVEADELGSLIRKIRSERNLGILLVEHHMKLVMGLCNRILVLDHGELIAQGTPDEIKAHAGVIDAYLGVAAEIRDA